MIVYIFLLSLIRRGLVHVPIPRYFGKRGVTPSHLEAARFWPSHSGFAVLRRFALYPFLGSVRDSVDLDSDFVDLIWQ